jgi:hypothetical protein
LVSVAVLALASPDKPAAVTLCFDGLPETTPLFSATAVKNYRQVNDTTYVLDMDLKFNGNLLPSRVTKGSGPSCLKAWLLAQPIDTIEATFTRTDTNLRALPRKVNLKLKPDLWYDGGAFTVATAPFSKVSSSLPGSVELTFKPPIAPGLEPTAKDLSHVSSGEYTLTYRPPVPPEGACGISVSAEARGTTTLERHPEALREILDNWRHDFAPKVIRKKKIACREGDQISFTLEIYDGLVYAPLEPSFRVVPWTEPEHAYQLVRNGESRPFKLGGPVHIGYGESWVLEQLPR